MNLLPDSIWLATDPVDMRTGVDGLSLHVQQALGRAPCDGTAYVFSNRRRIRLKVVSWDGTGVWMCLRRLHRGPVKRKVAEKPLQVYKQRIRELTRRSGGRSMSDVVQGLRSYMLGWKGHFQLAQTPKVWRRLDEWLRRRLRAIQLRHWKRGATMYRELPKLGGTPLVAKQVAANGRRWWRNSDRLLKTIMTIGYFDQLGVPRLS